MIFGSDFSLFELVVKCLKRFRRNYGGEFKIELRNSNFGGMSFCEDVL